MAALPFNGLFIRNSMKVTWKKTYFLLVANVAKYVFLKIYFIIFRIPLTI